jgi:hypothetical protein
LNKEAVQGIKQLVSEVAQKQFDKMKNPDDLMRLGILEQEIIDVKNLYNIPV